jgi:membrane fusion protein (multidrug efflux system)
MLASCAPEADVSAENTSETAISADDHRAIDVRVTELKTGTIQDFTTLTAKLEARKEISLTARVSGEVRSFVENGKNVAKGATVFDIDGSLYYANYKAAEAQANFAAKNAEKLTADYKKYEALFASNDISRDELLRHEVSMLQAKQIHQSAETQKRQALLNYQNASYKAPFSGVVGQMNLTVGQQVSIGEPIGKFADVSAFKAVFSLSLDEAKRFKAGQKAHFEADGIVLEGHVVSVSPLADSQTGSYLTKVEFPASQAQVFSGQYGHITLYGDTFSNVFYTHQDNVILNNGEEVIYLVQDKKTVRVVVKRVQNIGDYVIVSGPLKNGDLIVTTAVGRLAGDVAVTILDEER